MNPMIRKANKELAIFITLMISLSTFSLVFLTTTPTVLANISKPTVSVDPSTAGIVNADYTIDFAVGPAGALDRGVSSITLVFPVDTTITSGFIPGTVNGIAIVSSIGTPATRKVQIVTPVNVSNNGVVTIILPTGITNPTVPNTYNITVWTSAEGVNVHSDNYTITGAADSMSMTVQPTETVAGTTITPAPAVTVVDASDNPVAGIEITVSEMNYYVFNVGTVTQTTDPEGVATFDDLVINIAQIGYQLLFTADAVGVDNVTSDYFNVTASSLSSLSIVVQPSTTTAGTAITPAVQVRAIDEFGNNISGLQINATLQSGSGILSGDVERVTSVGTGIADFDNLSIDLIGEDKALNFSCESLFIVSDVFSITAGAVNSLFVLVQPSNATAGETISPAIQVRAADTFGNNISGLQINASLQTGTGVLSGDVDKLTASDTGIATFDDLSIDLTGSDKVLNFTADSVFITSTAFSILTGALASLSVVVQPTNATAGAPITPPIQLRATDSFGNPVSGVSIDVLLKTGSGVLSGTITQVTNGSGIVVFNDLSIDLIGEDKVLNFSSGSIFVVSKIFSITASTVNSLFIVVQPSNTTSGEAIMPAVQVRAVDAFGNNISGVQINATLQTGSGILSGDVDKLTAAGTGIATFGNLSIDLIGVDKIIRFSAGIFSVETVVFAIFSTSQACYAVMDADHNGNIYSYVDVYFNTTIDNSSIEATDFNLSLSGVSVSKWYNDGNTNIVTLKLNDKLTGGGPTLTIKENSIYDLLGNPIPYAQLIINTYRIPLSEGWNMFSIPGDVSGISIPTLLGSVWPHIDRTTNILWYNASTNVWKYCAVKTQTGTLSSIEPGKAYWIHMNASDTLIGNYSTVLHGTNPAPIIELIGHRWNMIGTWTTYNQSANRDGGLSSLYDVLNETGEIMFKYTKSGGFIPVYGNSTIKMQPGDGFWLYLRTSSRGYYTIAEP